MVNEFIYTVNPYSKNPIMLVNQEIGDFGIMGSQFQAEILTLAEMDIENVNSVGGSVIEGMSIYNSIIECKVPVITINAGVAASIASVIFLAGNKRIMFDYSVLMVHNPFNSDGSEDKSLDTIRESIIRMITERSNISAKKMGELMDDTTWIEAEDALKYGLCEEIKSSSINARWQNSNLILNKLISKNKDKKMDKLIEILNESGLKVSNTATEQEVYDVIKSFIKLKTVKNEDETEMEDKCNEDGSEMEDKYNSLKDAYDALVNEVTNMKKEMEDKSVKEMEDKINTLINSAVKNGKIKSDSIDMCKKMAAVDFKGLEKFLNDLPVNKTAPKIEAVDNQITDQRLLNLKADTVMDIMKNAAKNLK